MKQKQTQRPREQTCGIQRGGEVGDRVGLGVQGSQVRAVISSVNRQQGPTL